MCCATRQSRHALWCDFAARSLAKVDPEAAAHCTKIGPPVTMEDGKISRQLLVIRPNAVVVEGQNDLRFAVPINVWRVARKTVKSGRKLLAEGKLPVEFISELQVLLLTPQKSSEEGCALMVGTFLVCNGLVPNGSKLFLNVFERVMDDAERCLMMFDGY